MWVIDETRLRHTKYKIPTESVENNPTMKVCGHGVISVKILVRGSWKIA